LLNHPNSDKEALIFQHADDTTLTVSNKESVEEIFKVFEIKDEKY
jgi:hypothetical protein